MTTVALGVVAYRDPGSLAHLLESAHGFDQVLVANMSIDPHVGEVCRRFGAQELPVAGNPGFATGVGVLAAAATTSHLLFTNDDVWFRAGTADRARAAARPGAVVCPRIVDPWGRTTGSVRAVPTPLRVLLELVLLPDRGPRFLGVQKWRRPTRPEVVPAATAAAVLVDRTLLLSHPLPTSYVLYWEELSWFWSLHDAGVRAVLDPSLDVVRVGGRDELGPAKWRLLGANLVRLGRERYGRLGQLGYAGLALLWLARLAVTDGLRADREVRWRARAAGFRGVIAAAAGRS